MIEFKQHLKKIRLAEIEKNKKERYSVITKQIKRLVGDVDE